MFFKGISEIAGLICTISGIILLLTGYLNLVAQFLILFGIILIGLSFDWELGPGDWEDYREQRDKTGCNILTYNSNFKKIKSLELQIWRVEHNDELYPLGHPCYTKMWMDEQQKKEKIVDLRERIKALGG